MKILIIGAGGVASHLIPMLQNTLKGDLEVILQDADILEKRNLDRQRFDEKYIGMNKAEALLKTTGVKGKHIPTWFSEGTYVEECDLIICCADNNACREAILNQADQQQIPVIIAGNETYDGQSFVYFPCWKDTKCDPRLRYKDIITDESFNPVRCTDTTVVESAPQTMTANIKAAIFAHDLLFLWWRDLKIEADGFDEISKVTPVEIYYTKYKVTVETRETLNNNPRVQLP